MESSLFTRPPYSDVKFCIKLDKDILPSCRCLQLIPPRTFYILYRLRQEIKFCHPSSSSSSSEEEEEEDEENCVYKNGLLHKLDPWENSYLTPTDDLDHVKYFLSLLLSDIPFCTFDDEFLDKPIRSLSSSSCQTSPDRVVPVVVQVKVETHVACWESDVPSILSDVLSSRKQPKQIETSVLQLYTMIRRSEVSTPDRQCVICFEELGAGSRATALPCSHIFHTQCILTWLDNNLSCPLCRSPLTDLTGDNSL
ncbi:zinc finger protein, putative [Ricinus communis]|uniref:Zinc finger protein, putative n=1 Tax=Ricinus communis TaxID=3988 RepID=B9SHV2_RICCO|nr:zinc finger protein, putative [Ricinus communis]|eukprot:XP_025014292.1 putative RING-H2 finger protein ATL36 [Ricinus communis]